MPVFIEVCAGAGGLSSGLVSAGFMPLMLNDNNKKCCDTLRANHTCEIICDDMENLDVSKYIGKIDLLAGGIPCQSFSQAGKRLGTDDPRGKLVYTFAKLIKSLKPSIFLVENVKGLMSHNCGETLKNFISVLSLDGAYDVSYELLNSFNYEVPQKRERLFIIGVKCSNIIEKFIFPEKKTKKIVLSDVLIDVPQSIGAKYSEKKLELFKLIPQGGCWIDLPIEKQKEYLGKSFTSGGGKRGILRRLAMSEPCLTLLCSPTQKQTERCHPLEDRPLTVREYARIQTFPDDFQFSGSMSAQYKQIGNAVPPKLAYFIGIALMDLCDRLTPPKSKYEILISDKISKIFSRNIHTAIPFDILDSDADIEFALQSLRIKQRQMKYGEVWQVAIGNFDEFCDLGIGHETGLDVMSKTRKIIIELKNRYNTDNSSSRKANNDKLAKFKCANPD